MNKTWIYLIISLVTVSCTKFNTTSSSNFNCSIESLELYSRINTEISAKYLIEIDQYGNLFYIYDEVPAESHHIYVLHDLRQYQECLNLAGRETIYVTSGNSEYAIDNGDIIIFDCECRSNIDHPIKDDCLVKTYLNTRKYCDGNLCGICHLWMVIPNSNGSQLVGNGGLLFYSIKQNNI